MALGVHVHVVQRCTTKTMEAAKQMQYYPARVLSRGLQHGGHAFLGRIRTDITIWVIWGLLSELPLCDWRINPTAVPRGALSNRGILKRHSISLPAIWPVAGEIDQVLSHVVSRPKQSRILVSV